MQAFCWWCIQTCVYSTRGNVVVIPSYAYGGSFAKVKGLEQLTNEFHDALVALDRPQIEALLLHTVSRDGPMQAVEGLIVPALVRLGEEWDAGKVALSQIYMSSRICEDIVAHILPANPAEQKHRSRQAIVVLSDYHSLGKRIVLSVMRASGLDVIDYGRMEVDELVGHVVADDVKILLISVLMLPSALKVKQVRAALDAGGCKVRIAVGGAPFLFDSELWREVGADAMGRNAADAVTIVRRWQEDIA